MAFGKRVVVTGGSGLLGSRMVLALINQGWNVKVLDVRYGELEPIKSNPKLAFTGIGDDELRGGMGVKKLVEEAVRDADVVYHLAINWNGATWKHQLPSADLFDVNIRGTLNLLEAAKAHGVRHFLFSSSAAVYGETERTLTIKRHAKRIGSFDEESVCRPELWDGDPGPTYAILKLTTEKLCLMYQRRFGLPVTIFRMEYIFADESQLNDYANIHVDDVVQAFLLATLNKKSFGQVFNLAYPVPYISTRKIQKVLGWKPSKTEAVLEKHWKDVCRDFDSARERGAKGARWRLEKN